MITDNNDEIIFSAEENTENIEKKETLGYWNVLISDDERDVHAVTKMALDGFKFMGKEIRFFSAYSGLETCEFLKERNDIALIILDVVMEENNTGLEVINYVRTVLNNKLSRIILRTGQPGQAPEKNVVLEYDINDYKTKTELTAQKLFTSVVAALRDYENLVQLSYVIENLEDIVTARTNDLRERNEEIQTQNEEIQAQNEEIQVQNDELLQANEDLTLQKKQVEESQRLFKCFYDAGLVGLANTSPKMKWINANEYLCKLLEYSWEELSQTTWDKLTHPDDLNKDLVQFQQLLKGEINGYELEKRFITKSGKAIETKLVVRIARKGNGNDDLIVAMIQDLTKDRKKDEALRKNERLLKQMSKIAKIGSWEIDLETMELIWTDETYRIFEVDPSQKPTVEKAISFYSESSRPIIEKAVNRAIKHGESYNLNLDIITATGTPLWTNSIGQAYYKDGKIVSVYGIIQDISSRKEVEFLKEKNTEIQHKNEEFEILNKEYLTLNEEYKIQNEKLILAKEKAEESDRLKSAFLANMSHEIRTPMNGILGLSQLLDQEDTTKEEQTELVSLINKCGEQLLTIIDDIIDIAKIEANLVKISMRPTSMNTVVTDLFKIFKAKADAANIELILTTPEDGTDYTANTDTSRLKQVLTNLIGNALKFTPEGHVKFGYQIKGSVIEFFVEDTGIGVPENMQAFIFERFIQVETEYSKMVGGNGLGLSISKGLVELLGGTIWMKSEPNNGATFFFTIPLSNETVIEETRQHKLEFDYFQINKRKTILVAEDENVNFLYINKLLKKLNVDIIHVTDGQAAIDVAQSNDSIDLILMDMKMPIVSGYEATREIRKFNKTIPIIAQTAYAQDTDKNIVLETGCNEYIPKPFSKDQFFAILQKYLIG